MNERYYRGIETIKELDEVQAVNDHLQNGWELLAIKERSTSKVDDKGNLVQDITLVYIMGFKKTPPTFKSKQGFQPSIASQQAQEPALSLLPWKPYKEGEGDWIFQRSITL